jgi:hypothetical protein
LQGLQSIQRSSDTLQTQLLETCVSAARLQQNCGCFIQYGHTRMQRRFPLSCTINSCKAACRFSAATIWVGHLYLRRNATPERIVDIELVVLPFLDISDLRIYQLKQSFQLGNNELMLQSLRLGGAVGARLTVADNPKMSPERRKGHNNES